jgi:protein SCO1/2
VGQPADATLPASVARADLVASTGKPFKIADLRGKVVVISDMMTLCQETCPLDTANVVAAARAAERDGFGNRVEFLSVTIDPERDTVSRLAAYRRLYRPAPADWTAATGAATTLSSFWRTLGVISTERRTSRRLRATG